MARTEGKTAALRSAVDKSRSGDSVGHSPTCQAGVDEVGCSSGAPKYGRIEWRRYYGGHNRSVDDTKLFIRQTRSCGSTTARLSVPRINGTQSLETTERLAAASRRSKSRPGPYPRPRRSWRPARFLECAQADGAVVTAAVSEAHRPAGYLTRLFSSTCLPVSFAGRLGYIPPTATKAFPCLQGSSGSHG